METWYYPFHSIYKKYGTALELVHAESIIELFPVNDFFISYFFYDDGIPVVF